MFLIFTMKQSGAQGRNVRHESATRSNESHGTEMQGTAYQSNADCPLETVGFPSRFGSNARHGIASSCVASWRKAGHGISKQRGLPTGNSGFSESFWLEGNARTRVAMQCMAPQSGARHRKNMHRMAVQCTAYHSTSKQRAPRSGNRPLCRSLWPTGWVFIRSFTNLNVKEFQL